MRRDDVVIGGVYTALVRGKVLAVRIKGRHRRGGWRSRNLDTKREVRINNASMLLRHHELCLQAIAAADQENARLRDGLDEEIDVVEVSAGTMSIQVLIVPGPAPELEREPARRPVKQKTLLEAAAEVLRRTVRPMTAGEIVRLVLATRLWETSGKTPQATLYAALIREIARKGEAARFVKVGRGQFDLRQRR